MNYALRAGGACGTVNTVAGMVPRLTKGSVMLHYYIVEKKSGQRFDRRGNPVLSTADEAKLPSVSLASAMAHMVCDKVNRPIEVWRVGDGFEAQVAVYFPREIGEGGGK